MQPFDGLPATYFGDVAYATYNLTCLKDTTSGDYCTDFIDAAFDNITTDSDALSLPANVLCSPCIVDTMKQMQSTPYSNYGPDLASQWSSIQTTCGISFPTAVQPLQTNMTDLPGFTSPNTTVSINCASGNSYKVANGDNCQTISQSQGVSTGALISINQLLPDCSDLEIDEELCLPQTCSTYVVQPNDSCYSIAQGKNLLQPEIIAWNPALNNCE